MIREASEQELGDSPMAADRSSVRKTVLAHVPSDVREMLSRQEVLRALETLADPFDEHSDPVHLTGSAILVGARGTVLHVHKRLGRWLQPGGHIEAGEAPYAAAARESREETGLALSHPRGGPRLIHIDVHTAAKGHTHLDLRYLLVARDEDPSPEPGESTRARWFSWAKAEELADDSLMAALRVARLQPEVRCFERTSGADASGRMGSSDGRRSTTPE